MTSDIEVRHIGGDAFAIRVRGHDLVVDQPTAAAVLAAAKRPERKVLAAHLASHRDVLTSKSADAPRVLVRVLAGARMRCADRCSKDLRATSCVGHLVKDSEAARWFFRTELRHDCDDVRPERVSATPAVTRSMGVADDLVGRPAILLRFPAGSARWRV